MKPIKFNFKLKPKQAIKYLQNKGFKLSFDYDEIKHAAHHQSFTVAKVTRVDLLNDIFTSLDTAMQSGENFKDWKDNIKPTLIKKGWYGEQEIINPKTGEVKKIRINSRRLKTIFNINMRVAYSVERHDRMRAVKTHEYWRYKAMMINTRDAHAAMHGKVVLKTDPFWQTNYPPNGWNCKCKVTAHTKAEVDRRKMPIIKNPKNIAQDDWAYDVGAGSKVARLNKINLDNSLQHIPKNKSLDKLTDQQLKQRFYKTLAIKSGGLFIDKIGDPMNIGDDLFQTKKGLSKLKKQQRHLYIDELAKTISNPDEIILNTETRGKKTNLVKKMFRYFEDKQGEKQAVMGVFTYDKDKTINSSLYVVRQAFVDDKRSGKLIYSRHKKTGK